MSATEAPAPNAAGDASPEVPPAPISPAEGALRTLWCALPSVQRYAEDYQLSAPALEDDLIAFVKAAFKATRINADDADASRACDELRAELPPVPALDEADLPPLISGGEDDSAKLVVGTIPRAYFEDVVINFVAKKWLPPGEELMALRPQSAPASPGAGDKDKPADDGDKKKKATKKDKEKEAAAAAAEAEAAAKAAVPIEQIHLAAQLDALVESLVDDRPPRALLAFADVVTLPIAKTIPVELASFTRTVVHPAHPACYDTMWAAIEKGADGRSTEAGFVAWFSHWLDWSREGVTARRADIAGHTHWLDATAVHGYLDLAGFIAAARQLALLYVPGTSADDFFAEYVAAAKAAEKEGGVSKLLEAKLAPRANRERLVDVRNLYVHDELDMAKHEAAVSRNATENRIIVSGLEGCGKTTVGRALAQRLGATFVDVFDLALEAVDAGDALGKDIRELLDAEKPVPLSTQAALVKRCLEHPRTEHRGYVFADVPPAAAANQDSVEDFVAQCEFRDWPSAIVNIRMPADIYAEWRNDVRRKRLTEYEEELALRAEEKAAVEAAANAASEREARKLKREAALERQAKIDAGEIEANDEDKQIAEAGGVDAVYPEEEEPQPEVDEDGNVLEPEQIQARDAARAAAIARRKLLAELRRQIQAGRHIDAQAEQIQPLELKAWAPQIEHCRRRDRVVELASYDDAAASAAYAVERLKLVKSVVPQLPDVPADQLEGIEPGPDGDNQLAEIYRTALTEAGMGMSPWESFCPVTKMEDGVLVNGSWAFACHFRGFMYCFASKAKLQRFLDRPLPYLLQSPNDNKPVLLMSKTRAALREAGVDVVEVERALAEALEITPGSLDEYHATWKAFEDEVARRKQLDATRRAADAKAIKAREERARKAREADSKKKKAADKKKKPKEGEADGAEQPEDQKEEAKEEEEAPPVQTTEERIQAEIDAAVARRETKTVPHLVSCLQNITRDEILALLDRRQLPETVVVLEHVAPKPEGEEDEEEAPADDEEEEQQEPELDEDGNPIPRKPKTPKPFDQDDEKMYGKLVNKLLEEFAVNPEDEAPPAEEGAAAPLPRQAFQVKPLNIYGMSAADVVATVVRLVRPVLERSNPPQDGEELQMDDEAEDAGEEEEGKEKKNPLLVPGKKAIHQYGTTLKYCPVTLAETGVLVTGDPANWLSYSGGRYTFVTPEAMERFRLNPERYLPSCPPKIPAPRFWLLGVPFAGKRTLAKGLMDRFGIPAFSMEPAALVDYIAAACKPDGGVVNGVQIPHTDPASNRYLAAAMATAKALKDQEEDEQAKLKAKEEALAAQAAREEARENGEEVDELEEEEEAEIQRVIEFEPEEEEAKAERVAREQRRIAANLMRIEPFESCGYVLIDHPNSEAEVEQLLEFNAVPEAAINLKLSSDLYVARRCDAEFAKRMAEYEAQLKEVKAARRRILRKQRAAEIEKWRRRNIGGGDEEADEEELPEDPEAPQMDGVKGDLEGQFENDNGNVQAVLGLLPDKRIRVVDVNGDWGYDTVLRTCVGALSVNLEHRRSLLENPLVVTFDQAVSLVESGRKYLSSFRFRDPVKLALERSGAPPQVKKKPDGRGVAIEEEIPEPEPAPPKPKRMKTITKENEETGETEEVEVTDDEPEEEEEAAPEAEEEELEAEPDLSPEELEEMQAEHDAKMRAIADTKKQRACVLRNRVYFFDSDETLLKFITESPLAFWDQPPPEPAQPCVVAVMDSEVPEGPFTDDSRPRCMAEHIAYNMNAVYLDVPKVLKWATRTPKLPTLQRDALRCILDGAAVPEELVSTALACRLLCSDVLERGAVISNLPRAASQFQAMLTNGVTLHKVLVQPPYKSPVLDDIETVANVVAEMRFERFTNAALIDSFEAVLRNHRNRQRLYASRRLAFPARTHDTSQRNAYLRESRSVFKTYCPYMWIRKGCLVDSLGDTTFAAEYCGEQFYFSSEEYLQQFLESPDEYSGHSGSVKQLPTVLPTLLPAGTSIRSTDLEHAGCCPVTLYETRDRKGLKGVLEPKAVLGDPKYIIEYAGKKYALVDEEAVGKFLRQPWVFVEGAVLPLAHRMPFDRQDIKSQSTELYIRRMLYEETARAMLAVAETRPKFPGMSAQDSALKFVALYLKAHNSSNTEHRQTCYERSFQVFKEQATLYKDIDLQAPEGEEALAEFRRRCDLWDAVQDDPEVWRKYQHPAQLTQPPE